MRFSGIPSVDVDKVSLNQISNPIEAIGLSLIDSGYELRIITIIILPIILLRNGTTVEPLFNVYLKFKGK